MNTRILRGVLAALLLTPFTANAVVMLEIDQITEKDTANPEDIQCIIYGNSCPGGQQDMAAYNFVQGGNQTEHVIEADPNQADSDGVLPDDYTVGYLETYVGRVFGVGIDVNTTGAEGEMLDYFNVYINETLEFSYDPDPDFNIGAVFANGNGYFDWILSTIDLTNFEATDVVRFETRWYDASDGAENFFLVRLEAPPVPEPGTLALLGLGLAGFGIARRRRAA